MPAPAAALAKEKDPYARVAAPCPVFGVCGGCALQDLAYEDQLRLKHARVSRALARVDPAVPVPDVVPMAEPWRYRNKAELTFGDDQGRLVLGYHAAGSYWRLVDLDDCLLLPEPLIALLRDVRDLAAASGLPAYHPRAHRGFFRYLLLRHSRATGAILLGLVTASGPREPVEAMAEQVCRRHSAVTGIYWGVTDRLADVAVPEQLTLVAGRPHLEDQIGPFRVALHPLSFLQPSSEQAQRIYEALADGLADAGGGIAWDLYCGTGLIAFYLARHFRTVYAVDVEPHHIALAQANAARNGIANVACRVGRVETLLADRRFWLQEARPDAVAVDPPRAGLHPEALSAVLAGRPRRVAYLSCNLESLARDLGALTGAYPRYRIRSARAFDMFPQTNHVETLVVLAREGPGGAG
jgi:23S rRNA (uracil1939-C5)-methyltransferase